jgi:hypothetical protein
MGLGFDKKMDDKIRHHLKRKNLSGKYITRLAFVEWVKEMDHEEHILKNK